MSNSVHYQFRADPELEALIRQVWDPKSNQTTNMHHIVRAGAIALATKKGGK